MKLVGMIAAAALLTLAGCASTATENAASAGPRDCFRADNVSGYSVIDDHNIGVRAGARSYILTTTWNARDLDWTQAIAIRSTTDWICTGNGLGVDIIGGNPERTFPVSSIARAPNDEQPTGS